MKNNMGLNSPTSARTRKSSGHLFRNLQARLSSIDMDANYTNASLQSNSLPNRALSQTISPEPAPAHTNRLLSVVEAVRNSKNITSSKNMFTQTSLPYKVVKNRSGTHLNNAPAVPNVSKNSSRDKQQRLIAQTYTIDNENDDENLSNTIPSIVEEIISDDEGENVNDNAPFSSVPAPLQDDNYFEITKIVTKSGCQLSDFTEIRQVKNARYNCKPGKCVELKDGSFLRIKKIVEDRYKATWIIGQLFLRHNNFKDTKWPRRHNEVVRMVKVKNQRLVELVKKSLNEVLKNRHLIVTNQSFPTMSCKDHSDSWEQVDSDKKFGPLFCRWKQTHVLDTTGRVIEESIEKISSADSDSQEPGARIEPSLLRALWRQRSTTLGGEHFDFKPQVTERGHEYIEDQMYVFADAFCGAGGASCGANQAGLYISLGIDLNEKAVQTYELNFARKGAECRVMDIFDFIGLAQTEPGMYKVDVLHISPPCQPFSPAHTVANEFRDDINQAAMFAVGELLRILRPRVVTLEETYGLFNRHKEWFNALIKMFLDCSYSIRWTGARLEEYGLPQKRRRLLIIASGPGESLPPFPPTTHSDTNPTVKRLMTIHDAISMIPRSPDVLHHDIDGACFPPSQFKIPYSPHTQAKTITTSGGIGNHHPSGKRNFTIRELASLQRFPVTYKFANVNITELRRQIGNAVPPFVFKKVYREIIKSLKKSDSIADGTTTSMG